jgi:pre-60S factor REI1
MSLVHSFFIPDADYLIDISGLISYLALKILVGNICIFCNGQSREFRTTEAVWQHMVDKSHCKIAYDTEEDRLEISDYYDFTSSYPDFPEIGLKKGVEDNVEEDSEVWEDVDIEGDVVDEYFEDLRSSKSDLLPETECLPNNYIIFDDRHLELVLPSGTCLGHRAMRQFQAKSVAPRLGVSRHTKSGPAHVHRLLTNENQPLIPRKGGFGAFGAGTDLVKARNRGEAREAGRHVREHRDQRYRENFRTKVAFIHNSQRHFRNPCEYISFVCIRILKYS